MLTAEHGSDLGSQATEYHTPVSYTHLDVYKRQEIVRSRFPIAYNPQAEKPVVWLRFLSDLLYPEDIPTFQEYIGYCLVPSTKGQRMICLLYTSRCV